MRGAAKFSRRSALVSFGGAFVAAACARADSPVDPVWGKEPCAHCRMLVGDKRYASQILEAEGERRFFDDIGCMILWMDAHRPPARAWVREATSGVWLDARTAHYVQGARTPMDFGFEARAVDGVSFETAREAVRARKRTGG